MRDYRAARRESFRAYEREYRQRSKAHFAANRERILRESAAYRAAHPERRRAAVRKSYAKHREKRQAYYAEYRAKNRERIAAYHSGRSKLVSEQQRERKETDLHFRIRCNLSTRISAAVRRSKGRKWDSSAALIGCTIADLRVHLESLFRPGMSWANYGEWHIDHRQPCAAFDLREESQQLACFHFLNLQPLWRAENCAKGAKLPPPPS